MSIELQFVCERDIGSQLICLFSRGHVSHVDARLNATPQSWLLGARSDNPRGYGRGVRVRPYDYTAFVRREVMRIPATPREEALFAEFLCAQIGRPYDWRCILGFIAGRDWREADAWICSELIAAALEYALVVPKLYLAANKITPADLALACSAIGGHIVRA